MLEIAIWVIWNILSNQRILCSCQHSEFSYFMFSDFSWIKNYNKWFQCCVKMNFLTVYFYVPFLLEWFHAQAKQNLLFSSVTQVSPTLCNPMDCSTPGLHVRHQLPELTQTHVHWVSDAIQPSDRLSFLSFPALNLSQHQGLFQWVGSSHRVAKVLARQLQHQSFQLAIWRNKNRERMWRPLVPVAQFRCRESR